MLITIIRNNCNFFYLIIIIPNNCDFFYLITNITNKCPNVRSEVENFFFVKSRDKIIYWLFWVSENAYVYKLNSRFFRNENSKLLENFNITTPHPSETNKIVENILMFVQTITDYRYTIVMKLNL